MNTTFPFTVIAILTLAVSSVTQADTVRDYAFTGILPLGTIDPNGTFAVAGTDIGGDTFAVNVLVDQDTGNSVPYYSGYSYYGGPDVATSYTINGKTVSGAGGYSEVDFAPDELFRLTAGGIGFVAQLTSFGEFPVQDVPGHVDLSSCFGTCTPVFTSSFSAAINGITLPPDLQSLDITDSASPVPLSSSAWFLLSGLGGLVAIARRSRFRH